MTDREFIKAELQKLQKTLETRADMYIGNDNWNKATDLLSFATACRGALELLKEQDAKEVKESTNMYTGLPITHCPKCGVSIDRYLYGRQHEGQINYCPYCGKAVKWE